MKTSVGMGCGLLFLLVGSALAGGVTFEEPFDGAVSVAGNGGTLAGDHAFVTGAVPLTGSALHLPPGGSLTYPNAGKVPPGAATVTLWVQPEEPEGGLLGLGSLGSPNSFGVFFATLEPFGSRHVVAELRDGGGGLHQAWSHEIPVPAGRFFHLAVTVDCGAGMRVCVDGGCGNLEPLDVCDDFAFSEVLEIGHTGHYPDADAVFDEMRVFDRAMTPAEVAADRAAFLDFTPPDVDIDPVASPTNDPDPVLAGSRSVGADISVAATPYALTGPVAYPTETTWSCPLRGLQPGTTVLAVTATAPTGSVRTVATAIVRILKGDVDGNGTLSTADAAAALGIAAGTARSPGTDSDRVDVDGDDRIGPAECIHALQHAAGLRTDRPVTLTRVPAYGTGGLLEGIVRGASPETRKIAVYIRLGEAYWTKPYSHTPLTGVAPDGSFSCDIATGGNDVFADRVVALLLPPEVAPPVCAPCARVPAIHEAAGFAEAHRGPEPRTLSFAGRTWRLKRSDFPCGPGPNYFSDREADAWVDADGLHLSVHRHDDRWYGTEAVLDTALGYGTYVVGTRGRIDTLDPNVVLGLFTWDGGSPESDYRELDIEFTRWGDPGEATNAQFAVQPCSRCPGCGDRCTRFEVDLTDAASDMTHFIVWQPAEVSFRSYYGSHLQTPPPPGDLAHRWTYTGAVPAPGAARVRVNLWLLGGAPPLDGTGAEVTVTGFAFRGEAAAFP